MNLREAVSTFRGHRVPHVNIIGRRSWWFALSGFFIALSIIGLVWQGLNYSIEFKGGAILTFPNTSGASVTDYQQVLSRFGFGDAKVAIVGNEVEIRTNKSILAPAPAATPSPAPTVSVSPTVTPSASASASEGPTPSASASASASPTASASPSASASASASPSPGATPSASATPSPVPTPAPTPRQVTSVGERLIAALAQRAGVSANTIIQNAEDIGPTWGKTISRKMLTGLIVFLLLVTLYITLRFELKMAIGALVALGHDLIITAGIYALVGREVTPETVIAILTILGYSLYDTVVIFDKVKENTESVAMVARDTYSGVVNTSLNQTLMRSVNTSLVVLLPIGSLLLFGGQTLKDFAFALFIGVASGTYSSVFVAAPLLALLKEREPRYQQIRQRAEARVARPGLRSVPAARSVPTRSAPARGVTASRVVDEGNGEVEGGIGAEGVTVAGRPTPTRNRAGGGTGGSAKKKKGKAQSRSKKPRRR